MIFKRNSQSPCPATRPTPSPCSLSANARHVAACRPWWAGCMLDKPNVITAARATIAEPSQFADKTLAGQDPDLQSSLPLRLTWIRLRGLLIQPKDCFFWLQFAGFGKNTTREVLYLHSWDTGGKLTLHGGHCPRCVARLAHALYCCPQMLSLWILKEQKLWILETCFPTFYAAHVLTFLRFLATFLQSIATLFCFPF